MTLQASQPGQGAGERDLNQQSFHLAVSKVRPDMLAKVGEVLATACSRIQTQMAPDETGALDPARVKAALGEITRLGRLGLQVQQIARVLNGEGHWVVERIDVGAAVRQALDAWTPRALQRGMQISGVLESLEAEVNPPVFQQLLDLGIEYALHIGQRLELRCGHEGSPRRPMVTLDIHVGANPGAQKGRGDLDDLQWLLFAALARASGRVPRRQMVGGERILLVVALDVARVGSIESGVAADAALLPNTPVAAGRRAWLVEPHEVTRLHALQLLEAAGMHVVSAASVEQVMSGHGLDDAAPDVVLLGFGAEEPACRKLLDAVRMRQPSLRVIELVDDDTAFAFSVPGTDLPARVGRHTLARTLVAAISQELDSV